MKRNIDIDQKLHELKQKMSREIRLTWIVETCLETLKRGEAFDVDTILQANPDVIDELKTRFELASILPQSSEIRKVPDAVWKRTKAHILEEYQRLYSPKEREVLTVSESTPAYDSAGMFVASHRRKLGLKVSEVISQLGIGEDEYRDFEGDQGALPEDLLRKLAQIIEVPFETLKNRLSQAHKTGLVRHCKLAARKKGSNKVKKDK